MTEIELDLSGLVCSSPRVLLSKTFCVFAGVQGRMGCSMSSWMKCSYLQQTVATVYYLFNFMYPHLLS
jgi:hypothetical protein